MEERCDPWRQARWDDAADPTMYLPLHREAGDLDLIAELAQQSGRPEVRVVAAGLSPYDPSLEYVEVQNVGAADADLSRLLVGMPGGVFNLSLAGSLAPGTICRVYTQPAGQRDACAGIWEPGSASRLPVWGGWISLRERPQPCPPPAPGIPPRGCPVPPTLDRWYYRP